MGGRGHFVAVTELRSSDHLLVPVSELILSGRHF